MYTYTVQRKDESRSSFFKQVGTIYTFIGLILITGGLIFILVPAFPYIYYNINPDALRDEVDTIESFTVSAASPTGTPSPTATISATPTITATPEPTLPPLDPNLPKTNTLIIPKTGVNGPINEGENATRALYRGIWRTPGWGTPDDFSKPTVLAAHRFGYLEWTENFRKTNSFRDLPKLSVGDTFSVIWGQRKFDYVVKRIEEVTLIDSSNTDMILYTCKYLKSPIRIVIFADRQ